MWHLPVPVPDVHGSGAAVWRSHLALAQCGRGRRFRDYTAVEQCEHVWQLEQCK